MILQLTVVIWLASSWTEYKIVKSSAWMQANFHGWKALVISMGISGVLGLTVGYTIGAVYGAAFVIAGMIGQATNEFTFNLFSQVERFFGWQRGKREQVANFRTTHPQNWDDAKIGVKGVGTGIFGFFMLIGKLIRFVGWLCTRPTAITTRYRKVRIDHRLPWEKKVA